MDRQLCLHKTMRSSCSSMSLLRISMLNICLENCCLKHTYEMIETYQACEAKFGLWLGLNPLQIWPSMTCFHVDGLMQDCTISSLPLKHLCVLLISLSSPANKNNKFLLMCNMSNIVLSRIVNLHQRFLFQQFVILPHRGEIFLPHHNHFDDII